MLGSISDILGIIKNIFSNFSSLIFLLLAIFLGLWIFEKILGVVFTLPDFLGKREAGEIKELVSLGKHYGVAIEKKELIREYREEKRRTHFLKLAKKYKVKV